MPNLKRLTFMLCYYSGLTRMCAWFSRDRVVILCYHGVTERINRGDWDPQGFHVRRSRFEEQLDYLARRYTIVSLRDYVAARKEGRPSPRYSVILTFDDGPRNFLTAAAPRLAERKVPASMFLITDRLKERGDSSTKPSWQPVDDDTPLTWEDARSLIRDFGMELGSHTCSHRELTLLSRVEVDAELTQSFTLMNSRLENGVVALAYPKGQYSGQVVQQVREAGYYCALTTDGGLNEPSTDLYRLRRTLIGDHDDLPAFAARVAGLGSILARIKSILLGATGIGARH